MKQGDNCFGRIHLSVCLSCCHVTCLIYHIISYNCKTYSNYTFSDTWLPGEYQRVCGKVQEKVKDEHISITTDLWSSDAQDGFLTLTGHFIDKNMRPQQVCLSMAPFNESHTGQNICDKIDLCLSKWEIGKSMIPACLRDSASNIVLGVRLADLEFDWSCFPHDLKLVIKDALLDQPEINEMFGAFRKMVGHFRHSNVSTNYILQKQRDMGVSNPLKLKQDMPARWHSEFDMLDRSLALKSYVIITVSDLKINIEITARQWALAQEVCNVLGVFYDATKKLEGDSEFISSVIPTVFLLKKAMKENPNDSDEVADMKKELLKSLENRFKKAEKENFLLLATILDPRYKDRYFSGPEVSKKARSLFIEKYEDIEDDAPLKSPSQVHKAIPEPPAKRPRLWDLAEPEGPKVSNATVIVNNYLAAPTKPLDSDPLAFWKDSDDKVLRKMVRIYFSAPASSAPSERIFSEAGLIVTDLRSRLDACKVEMLLFLNRNLRFLGEIKDEMDIASLICENELS